MLICVIVPRNIRRKFLTGFLTGLYGQSHKCDRVRVGWSGVYVVAVLKGDNGLSTFCVVEAR